MNEIKANPQADPAPAAGIPPGAPENDLQDCELIEYDGRIVLMEDIPEECRDIAEVLGLHAFLSLLKLCGGLNLYLPKLNSIYKNHRDREIRRLFNGHNYRQLAVQFRLAERQVRKIINGSRI